MPKKKTVSIGKDVLQSGKKLLPKKAELTIKPPLLPFVELKLLWEQKESGKISEAEYRRLLKNLKSKSKRQERKKRYHKSTPYV